MPGQQMVPGMLPPGLFGWDADMVSRLSIPEYTARVLAAICATALDHVQSGRGKLLNYHQLPSAAWPALMEHFGVRFSEEENRLLLAAARMNAKNPAETFTSDSQAKRDSVSPEHRELTRQWLDDLYQRLEARRRVQGFI
jgi:hypothetical protein